MALVIFVQVEVRIIRQLYRRVDREATRWIKSKKTPTLLELDQLYTAWDIIMNDVLKRLLSGKDIIHIDEPEEDKPEFELKFDLDPTLVGMEHIAQKESHFAGGVIDALLQKAPPSCRRAYLKTSAKLIKLRDRAFKRNREQYDEMLNKFL